MQMNNPVKLNDILHISHEDEMLYANNERSILFTAKAYGVFQRDLIENIGIERMKSFFFKYGYTIGKADAEEIMKNIALSLVEKIEIGPVIHTLKGFDKFRVLEKRFEIENNRMKSFLYRGTWEHSFEAEQHVRNFGKSQTPICYTLTGAASGYATTMIGEEVFFKELQCEAEGAPCCIWEGRLVSEWKDEADEYFSLTKELPIIKELEQTNEKLLMERNNLSFVTQFHTDLTDEIMKGKNLDDLLEFTNKQINLPVVLEDIHHHIISLKGITFEKYEPIKQPFYKFLKENQSITKSRFLHFDNGTRLATPIFFMDKIYGYCSILYNCNSERISKYEIHSLILERLASICSLYFFKEKTELESMERVKGHFLEEIISGKYSSQKDIIRKADYIHLDLSDHYHAIFLTYRYINKCEEKELTLHKNTFEAISSYFSEKSINILIGQQPDSLMILITQKQLNGQNIENMMISLVSFLKKEVRNAIFLAGISSLKNNIVDAGIAVEEARAAVRLSSRDKPTTSYNDLGIIGILINEKNENVLRKMVGETLGELYQNVNCHKIELIETLYHFLENGGKIEQTAEQLALSISGLRYRINKITDILGCDLREPKIGFQLLIAIKVLKIIDYELLASILNE